MKVTTLIRCSTLALFVAACLPELYARGFNVFTVAYGIRMCVLLLVLWWLTGDRK